MGWLLLLHAICQELEMQWAVCSLYLHWKKNLKILGMSLQKILWWWETCLKIVPKGCWITKSQGWQTQCQPGTISTFVTGFLVSIWFSLLLSLFCISFGWLVSLLVLGFGVLLLVCLLEAFVVIGVSFLLYIWK